MARRTPDYSNWEKGKLISRIQELEKRKKYGLVWDEEREPEAVVEQCKNELPVLKEVKSKELKNDPEKPTHILIEGDNYHALSVLNYTHEKKIDVIYIDPPFNSGSRSWKYNNNYVDKEDSYKHSKFITFISNRLRLAKNLLKDTGIIIVSIDDHEIFNLGLVMEDIFQEKNRIGIIAVETNPRGRTTNTFFATSHEYALIFAKDIAKAKIENIPLTEEQVKLFKFEDEISKYRLLPFRRSGGLSTPEERPNSHYPIYYDPKTGSLDIKKFADSDEIIPLDTSGKKRVWRQTRPSFMKAVDRGDIIVKKTKNGYSVQMKDRIKEGRKPKTIWKDSKYDASTHGTILLQNILGKTKTFDYPKSLYTVLDFLFVSLKSQKNALILDFFAGSGTTAHAVFELNKRDGGNRKVILSTNNENGICVDVCYPRIINVLRGYKDKQGREAEGYHENLKYYRTSFVPSSRTDLNKEKLTKMSVEMLCLREYTFELVTDSDDIKIFKNNDRFTGILFDERIIEEFKNQIRDFDKPVNVYIFSLGDDDYADEFYDMRDKVNVHSIPAAILRVYRRIFK